MSLKPKKIQLKYSIEKYGKGEDKTIDHRASLGPFEILVRECHHDGWGDVVIGWLSNDHSYVTPERGVEVHESVRAAKKYFEKILLKEIKKYSAIKDYL